MAEIYGFSVQTLRHYEDCGLIQPAWTDPETHYRYYGVEQLETLNTIKYLRTLDMPLSDMRSFFTRRNVKDMKDMLVRQQKETEERIRLLEDMKRHLDMRIELFDHAENEADGMIHESDSLSVSFLCLQENIQPKKYLDLEHSILKIKRENPDLTVYLGNVGIWISEQHLKEHRYSPYDGVFVLSEKGRTAVQPAGHILTVTFHGNHTDAFPYYRKLETYMQEKGFEPCGMSRETVLIDEGMTDDRNQFVTMIEIPVRRKENEE